MKKNYLILVVLMLAVSVLRLNAQTYNLKSVTEEQFASGGTDEWSFERHDIPAGSYTTFTTYGDNSIAVNYYDQFLTERFCMYPIMNRPSSGTQYELKRNAWFSDPNEYVYVAAEYPAGTRVGENLVYGENYPDSLMGYEVYSIANGKNAAITFTVPQDGYYRVDMKVVRQDLWNQIGVMKVYQFFRYGGEGTAFSMGLDFPYGLSKGIDTWAAGNEVVYNTYLAKVPETPSVNGNNGKPYRGLPTYSTSSYFYFYAKAGDKISFEADARSTGNGESSVRGAYARTKWTNLVLNVVDEATAVADERFVNPYQQNEALFDSLYAVLDEAEDIINNHPEFSLVSRNALEELFILISQRVDDGVVLSMEIPTLIEQLRRAIEVCRASEGGLKVQYTFDNVVDGTVPDASGQNNKATLLNNAAVVKMGKFNVLDLGSSNGYLDMGAAVGSVVSGMNDYTISAYYRIDANAPLSGNGFMLFSFSSQEVNSASIGEYIFYRMPNQNLSMSPSGWGSAKNLTVNTAPVKGVWQHLVVQQSDTSTSIYVNGTKVASGRLPLPSANFTKSTPYNWIGRPPFTGDNYLKQTLVYDFRVYNYATPVDSITKWATKITELEEATNYSTDGDYTQLDSLLYVYKTFVATVPVGTAAGAYLQETVDAFNSAIAAAQAISTERTSSQLKINAEVAKLLAAYQTFLGSVNSEINTLAEGYYYITLTDSLYLTNPGVALLPNGSSLQMANGGLATDKNASTMNQVFKLTKVTSLAPARYSIFSALDEEGVFRHLTENTVIQNSWGNPGGGTTSSDDDWRTFNIVYNGSAYAIQNAGRSAAQGYWTYNSSTKVLAKGASLPMFVFKFIPYNETGVEELNARNIRVLSGRNELTVEVHEPSILSVYSITGSLIKQAALDGAINYSLPSGMYIVQVDGTARVVRKVIVK